MSSMLICSGTCSSPNVRLVSVVVVHKLGMFSSIDVPLCMEMIDGLLGPVNTVFTGEVAGAMDSFE